MQLCMHSKNGTGSTLAFGKWWFKGNSSNQIIYMISGPGLKSGSVGLVEVLMLYSSSIFTERTTTCRGGYTITCNTRSSNIFERDEADVKLEQM